MKGHMQDGKFHPHTDYKKGTRKSRDSSVKTQGVKIRKQRTVSAPRLIDADVHHTYFDFESKDGKIESLSLGNLSDAGYFWNGNDESINFFMGMMAGFKDTDEFIEEMDEAGVTLDMLRPQMLKNISGKLVDDETDDGLYVMSGGDSIWRFGNLPEIDLDSQLDGWDYYGDGKYFTEKEKEAIKDEFWMHYSGFRYEDFLREYGEEYRNKLRKMIIESGDIDELLGELRNEDTILERFEMYDQLQYPKINEAMNKTFEVLKKEGKFRKK